MSKRGEFKSIASTKKHPQYWKVKAAFLEQQQVEANAAAAVTQARLRLAKTMKDAGLDPKVSYTLDDNGETITAQSPQSSSR